MTAKEIKSVPLSRAAQVLGLAWPKAWALVHTGELQAEQIGGRWYVNADSLVSAKAARSSGTGRTKVAPKSAA